MAHHVITFEFINSFLSNYPHPPTERKPTNFVMFGMDKLSLSINSSLIPHLENHPRHIRNLVKSTLENPLAHNIACNLSFQDHLIPNSAWKDYSSNTNYGYDPRNETEEKNGAGGNKRSRSTTGSQQTTLPMSHSPPSKTQYYEGSRGGRYQNGNGDRGGESR